MAEKNEKVLSQADIDAMLSTSSAEPPASGEESSVATATKTKTATMTRPPKNGAAAPKREAPAAAKKEADTTLPGAEVKPYQQKAGTSKDVESLQQSLEDVVKRLDRVETVIEQLGEIEKKMAKQISDLAGKSSNKDNGLHKQVKEMSEQMEEICDNLRFSLGYGAAKIFRCSECDAKAQSLYTSSARSAGKRTGWGGGLKMMSSGRRAV